MSMHRKQLHHGLNEIEEIIEEIRDHPDHDATADELVTWAYEVARLSGLIARESRVG